MAASFTTRTGIPRARAKLKWIQLLPRCLGFRRIRPLRTGAGKPIDATSNFQPRTVSSNFDTNSFGVICGPEANSRSTRSDISSLTKLPPISTTRILLFISARPEQQKRPTLSPAPEQSPHATLRFRLYSGAGRPALYYLKHDEAEQQLPRRFQVKPEVPRNLLHRAGAIELRGELRLIRGQL